MPACSEALSDFGHRKYSVVSGAHVASPVPACMNIEKIKILSVLMSLLQLNPGFTR